MTDATDAYLRRIDVAADVAPTPDGLARLMAAHLAAVPFENLDIHLGQPIVLDVDRIVDKIVRRRRGGFCYELNGAFARLLGALGFPVALLEARVHGPEGVGIRFDHLCLEVDLGTPWLADVGFGATFAAPLRLDVGAVDQQDAAGSFRITDAGDGWYDLEQDGKAQYRFSRRPRRLADFADGCHYNQTSPDSHFTRGTICSLPVDGGRVTLSGSTLIRTTAAGDRTEAPVAPADLGATLASIFGVELTDEELARLAKLETRS